VEEGADAEEIITPSERAEAQEITVTICTEEAEEAAKAVGDMVTETIMAAEAAEIEIDRKN